MEVLINQQSYLLPQKSTLNAVLEAVQITAPRGIALAVNNKVIPKSHWTTFLLKHQDNITLIKATQGG